MKTDFKQLQERLQDKSLEALLDEISVVEIESGDIEEGHQAMYGWYGVLNDKYVIAYFEDEAEAFYYRLSLINRIMNS